MFLLLAEENILSMELTITRHANRQTLLESALLTPIAIDPHNCTRFVLQALFVLDILLDAPTKEALPKGKKKRHIFQI